MALWTVLLMRGLRRSEACALAWDDLDFANRTLRISKSLHRVDGHLQAMPTKTRPSNRTLPLPARCAYALAEHHRRLQELHGSGPGRPWHPTD
jgi:integrase